MKHIEVELRGPLNDATRSMLESYLKENGTEVSTQHRVFFDLSDTVGINNRRLDVRAKVTNGTVQLVAKKADPGSVSREEAEVSVGASLPDALHLLALLGYPKGVYGDRRIVRYLVGDIEFAIQDVVALTSKEVHSSFYEAEILTDIESQEEAEKRLRASLSELGLTVFSAAGWNEYEKKINAEANGWFDFGSTDISDLLAAHD